MKRFIFVLLVFLLTFSGCSQKPSSEFIALQTEKSNLQNGLDDAKNQISFLQSATPKVVTEIVTQVVTKIVQVTTTYTKTPEYTPTITPTYTPKPTETPTISPLYLTKGDGFFLIGIDIAPGIWRSSGTQDNCYWSVTSESGDIIDNHFGMSGGTAFLPDSGFQVQFEDCGNWEFLK